MSSLNELSKPLHNITQLREKQWVLVRDNNDSEWKLDIYSHHTNGCDEYQFVCVGDNYAQCIPYRPNKILLGTTKNPPEQYINW